MTEQSNDKPRILIVDDASENLHAMMSILGDTYAVTAATSGEKALELAAHKPQPDLMLLDIKMPGMDGYEVLRRIKVDPLTADIPVIIVTAIPESEDEAKGLRMGAADYIAKPVNPDWLKLRVLTQLELRRYRRKPIPPGVSAFRAAQEHFGILVVDDVPENIHQLISTLSDEYRIMVADNGPKAIEMVLGPAPPDLILLDILMPDMDGYEVCRRIKATETGNHIPVIFLSIVDEPLEKVRGFSIGAADFISKPFDIDEVRARIRTHLELSLLHRFFEQAVAQRTAALMKSENQLSEALEIAKVGYWEYEFATDEFVFNDKYYALHKITAEEAGGYRMSSADFARRYVHPEDALLVGQNVQLAFESADPDYFAMVETRILTGVGDIVWVEVRMRIEKDALGRTIRIFGVNQDITERKQAELVLRESERRFSDMLGNVEMISVMRDRDEKVTYCNEYLLRLSGWQREDVMGRSWVELFLPPAIAEVKKRLFAELLLESPEARHHESEILTRSGERRLIRWNNSVLRSTSGDVIGTASIGEDITEHKQAEQEIRLKNSILQTQQETSLDGILIVDHNNHIASYNQQFIELWQLPPQLVNEHVDAPLLKTVAAQVEDPEAFVARVQYLYEHPDDKSHEEIHLKDGRSIDRYSAPVNGADGKYYGRVWYFRDITERKRAEQELRDSRQRLDGIVTSSMDGIVTIDTDNRIVLINPAVERMFGYTATELLGQPLELLMPERFRAGHPVQVAAFGTTGVTSRRMGEFRSVIGMRKNCEEFPVEIAIAHDKSSEQSFFIATIHDVTERVKSDQRIRHLNRVYAVLSGINTLIVRVQDRVELYQEACRIATETGGFRMAMMCIVDPHTNRIVPVATSGKDEELLSGIKDILASSKDSSNTMVAQAIREKQTLVSNDSLNDSRVLFGKKYAESGVRSMVILPLIVSDEAVGALTLYAGEIEFFQDEEMTLLAELAGDIAYAIDHIDKQERINYLAYYDVLTGLANRTLFLERVEQYRRSAVTGGYKLAIGLIDLERFKNINDSLGRTAGDALLKQVADWMTHKMGEANLLARIDADHFAIVLPEVKSDGNLAQLVESLLAAFLEHVFHLNDAALRIGIKVGVALFPDDGADVDALFKNAEAALKKAKAGGDRYLFYTQRMTEAVASKLKLENRLRQAIDNEEFVLHYQPKVNFASGKVTSAEALLRWNDPSTGLVPPGNFIPILEETGMIHEVGRWALRQAAKDHLRWSTAGLASVRIAVNVSALQLRNPGFLAEIKQVIGMHALAAAGLELEITESLVMNDVEHNIAILQAVRALGITIAIDDFGTGFSSLSYLAKLPVNTLKIDRSFIIEMTAGPEGLALVSTIISLAHAFKLKVVAEGVETEEQSRLLRLLDCDEMQGFLFSKAVPCEVFETRFLVPL